MPEISTGWVNVQVGEIVKCLNLLAIKKPRLNDFRLGKVGAMGNGRKLLETGGSATGRSLRTPLLLAALPSPHSTFQPKVTGVDRQEAENAGISQPDQKGNPRNEKNFWFDKTFDGPFLQLCFVFFRQWDVFDWEPETSDGCCDR